MQAWSKVAAAVHENGGKIIIQLMQTGRIGHTLNMQEGAEILAPSAIRARGSMFTDSHYMQSYQLPRAMNAADIQQAIAEFATAASYAMEAGFDGVELHGANGYMIEQFLSPVSNIRTDQYGGNIENRARFALEAVEAVASAIGKDRTGVRFSPYGMTNDMYPYPEMDATYTYLAEQLNRLDIAFLHITNSFSMGSPDLPLTVKQMIRSAFKNTIIGAGGHTRETAEAEISYGLADLVAFGRPFINNPDLAERYQNNWPLSTNMDVNQIYRPGETGYTDYPVFGH
jgi:N-ethylmaleimide reductase